MVDVSLLQSLSYVAAAIGVCFASVYYVLMVRINQRTMRITLTNSLIQRLLTDEFLTKFTELMYMEWNDYDDFEKKYGSDEHPENYVKRVIVFGTYDSLGMLLLKGLADRDVLYNNSMTTGSFIAWSKFKPILEENRKRYSGKDAWTGFEYLANEMLKMKCAKDPAFKIPENYLRYVPRSEAPP